jgi:hypothetical protein
MSQNDTTVQGDEDQIGQTLREIDEVAAQAALAGAEQPGSGDSAEGHQQAGDGNEPQTEEQQQADRKRREEWLRERAKNQRARGRRELERSFVGVVGLQAKVTLNDRALASHFERFAGLVDNTIYLTGRRGALVLGAENAETLLSKINELIDAYADMAAEAERSTAALMADRAAATLDWVVPTYQRTALEMDLHIKTKAGAKLLRAAHEWDKAIYNLSVLAWNDEAKESQIDEARRNERNALARIFNFAVQIVVGIRRATQGAPSAGDSAAKPRNARDRNQGATDEAAFAGEPVLPEPTAKAD